MNRWAARNPELFEELGGNEGMAEYFRAGVDHARKERRENRQPCAHCGEPCRGHWCSDACRIAEDGPQDEDFA